MNENKNIKNRIFILILTVVLTLAVCSLFTNGILSIILSAPLVLLWLACAALLAFTAIVYVFTGKNIGDNIFDWIVGGLFD